MKFSLSNNKYPQRGLYLKYIVMILAFIQCCYAEVIINNEKEFQHFVYETGWRANAGIATSEKPANKWYNAEKYKESIFKVIAKAIADCILKKEEFDTKNDIITFAQDNHTLYSAANWNAVVLYNYLNYAIYNKGELDNNGVEAIGEKLKKHYGTKYWSAIEDAVNDIKKYTQVIWNYMNI